MYLKTTTNSSYVLCEKTFIFTRALILNFNLCAIKNSCKVIVWYAYPQTSYWFDALTTSCTYYPATTMFYITLKIISIEENNKCKTEMSPQHPWPLKCDCNVKLCNTYWPPKWDHNFSWLSKLLSWVPKPIHDPITDKWENYFSWRLQRMVILAWPCIMIKRC